MTEPAEPRDVDWPALLDLAERLRVTVWRLDATGNLVPVDSPATPQGAPRPITGREAKPETTTASTTAQHNEGDTSR